ncbi:MAG TPA: ATP-grasp fold amidoligase family protein [Gemmatimonadales bacterium]|nr:ATP-grasp fold amidoligase family protein [Gemmatimonadales bacterium]
MSSVAAERRAPEPRIRRYTRPLWVSLRLRMLLSWLPGPALQWLRYLLYYGKRLPLRHPRTFTERLLVKMGRDRRPLLTRTADRVAMRSWVEEHVGPGHLPPLLAVLRDPADLRTLPLPTSYVVKASHGSQMVAIVKQDSPEERERVIQRARRWLRTSYWRRHGEWGYKHIPRCLVVESFLGAPTDDPPPDWKWYCIGGRAALVSYDYDRFVNHHRSFYDPEGHQLDLVMDHRFEPGAPKPAPPSFPEMRGLAETLAQDFDFVRVDLYDRPEGILVGEMTHAPLAGLALFDPPEWDQRLGDLWGAALGEATPINH